MKPPCADVRIVGPPDRYPQAAERTYLADIATLKQLENVSATRAVKRFVIVAAVGSNELTERILADDPARLYEF